MIQVYALCIMVFFLIVLLAMLVDPIQILINAVVNHYALFLFFVYMIATVFELHDGFRKTTNKKIQYIISSSLKLIFLVILFVALRLAIEYWYIYFGMFFFTGRINHFDKFFSIFGEFFPVILASVIGWIFRHELLKYFDKTPASNSPSSTRETVESQKKCIITQHRLDPEVF